MKLGLNLSFAIKRWLGGHQLAHLVRHDLDFDRVQMTWDIINPDWPTTARDGIAKDYALAFEQAGIVVESTFGGVASYTYNNLLAPTRDLRLLGLAHLKNAIDTTAAMQVTSTGLPLGSYAADDAQNAGRRAEIYKEALDVLHQAARHAKRSGLDSLQIEPTPLATEFPASAAEAAQFMDDLRGQTDVPVKLLIDWGHALFKPLFGADANMEIWMQRCGQDIAAFHIQQTDGLLDRHWSFTREGIVTPAALAQFWRDQKLTDQTYLPEIIYPFEETDDFVLQDMKAGCTSLRAVM